MNESQLFAVILKLATPQERAAYLDEACAGNSQLRADLEALLDAHASDPDFLEQPAGPLGATVDVAAAPRLPGENLPGHGATEQPGVVLAGRYKLLEALGEGGMGTVWLAQQQEPVKRLVALKVIKPGMDSKQVLARFEAERQALALMDHLHIARVLDAGTTAAGRPFFVMELVKGVPITKYCDQHRLTPRERLELFIPVCQAIQHAHQKGIIHRDIKPSNVLVALCDDKPVPKVIDFGVAKAMGQQLTEHTLVTGLGAVVGTLEYMSPEQAQLNQLDIDTRSDVYSLGVLLYELLTGSTPLDRQRRKDAPMLEMLRMVREEESPRPSARLSDSRDALPAISAQRHVEPAQLTKLVCGELDWIVMKALEKDRNRRYETASAFAADVQRHLHDEPVLACPPSAWYRFRKFARRNKAVLATVSALVVAAVLALGSLAGAVKVLADTNTQTKEALDRETGAKEEKERALRREIQARVDLERGLYFQRIASVERELADSNAARAVELLDECPLRLRGWEWHYLQRLRYQEPFTFRGHGSWVMAVAFSPDGKRVASASARFFNAIGEVKVWDRQTGRVQYTLLRHVGPVTSVAFSPDGKRLATAGWDRTVKVWNAATGEWLHTLRGHSEYLNSVAFSSDGKLIASAGGDRTVKVWDVATYQELHALHGHLKGVYRVAFGAGGKLLASASGDSTVRVWDAAAGKELHVLRGHAGPVLGVAFSRDGRRLASAGGDGTVKLWDSASGRHVFTLKDSTAMSMTVAFSPDGKRLATGSWEKTVKVWDLDSQQEAITLRGHTDLVMAVTFSGDGQQIASASMDRTVRVWDAASLSGPVAPELFSLRGHTAGVTSVAWQPPHGKRVASASFDSTVRLWDVETHEEVRTLRHTGPVADVSFSRDGRRLASADIAGVVKVWDALTGREIRTFRGWSVRVALSPDGKRLASAVEGGAVHVWDAETGNELLRPFRAHDAPVLCLAFSPDGKRLATGGWDGIAKVWDSATGRELLTLGRHDNVVYGLAFSPDGKRLATASWDGNAKVWDAATGKRLLTLPSQKDRVLSVAFSPDGKRLATTSWGGTIKVWDAVTGRELASLREHTGAVMGVAFSPDGKRLATSGGSRSKGEVTIWDATGWQEKAARRTP